MELVAAGRLQVGVGHLLGRWLHGVVDLLSQAVHADHAFVDRLIGVQAASFDVSCIHEGSLVLVDLGAEVPRYYDLRAACLL